MDLIIDNEFRDLIPPLSDDEFKQLEENILRDGIRDPLTVWNGILIDGHNRYEIAQKHGLTFKTTELHFADRNEAKIWIIKNQIGRRNLPPAVRIKLALLAEPLITAQAKARQLAELKQYTVEDKCPQREEPPLFSSAPQDEPPLPPHPTTKTTPPPTPTEKNKIDRQNKTNYQLAQMAGVSDKTVQRYKKIQSDGSDEVKAQVDRGEISINEGYTKVLKANRSAEIQRQVDEIEQRAIENPDGLFDVIVIDPPWSYGDSDIYRVDGWRVSAPYPEMSQDALKEIELPAADNCVLCVWTTNQFIWDAKELIDAWGFKYRFMFVWNKQQMGIGRRIRMQCEFCLVALKGEPVFKDVHNIRDIIEEPRREHSRKPEKFYEIIDSLFAGRKLDYFSRTQREGWATYGNDTSKFTVA